MRELWKGNEAMAEAAVRAGMKMFVGYPITPQSDIIEYLSKRMPELNRTVIQSESEIGSINTVIGGSITGARCMTSSSGVGISLMQEGISCCFARGIPAVLIDVNRSGCGMGSRDFGGGQDDYLRSTRGGGNGDYRLLVYIPNTIQEAVDLVYHSFEVAEKYRNPVMILTEGRLGQMMEPVEMPEYKEGPSLDWGIDGSMKIMEDYDSTESGDINDAKYRAKRDLMLANEQKWETFMTEDADTVIVSVGMSSRVSRTAVTELRKEGYRVGLLRPVSAWPFPINGFMQLPNSVKRLVCVEVNNFGQVIEDVLITAKQVKKFNDIPVYSYYDHRLMSSESVTDYIKRIYNKEEVEVTIDA